MKNNIYNSLFYIAIITSMLRLETLSSTKSLMIGLGASLAAGVFMATPDNRVIPFEEHNLVTFLPANTTNDSIVAYDEDDIVKTIKNGSGCISVRGVIYSVFKGIPDELSAITEPITILATGFSPYDMFSFKKPVDGMRGYISLKQGTIQGPCIVYENPYRSRAALNFKRQEDIDSFKSVFDKVIAINSHAPIILYGICKGALNQLHFLHQQKNNSRIACAVFESPLLSFKHILKTIRADHPIIEWLIKNFLYPNAVIEDKVIPDITFPYIPALVGILPGDSITNSLDVVTFFSNKIRQNIEIFSSSKINLKHAHIGDDPDFAQHVRDFIVRNAHLLIIRS